MLASASFLVLLFCSTGAFAQSANHDLVRTAVGDALEASNYDLVGKAEAITITYDLKESYSQALSANPQEELQFNLKLSYVALLNQKLQGLGLETEDAVTSSIEELSEAFDRFKNSESYIPSVVSDVLSAFYN
ncbi:MAG: hypothetical protein MK212_20880 [Saprospiraceae bacterium]|nr:hypothetical protein [Saprospiraceae bacterium]